MVPAPLLCARLHDLLGGFHRPRHLLALLEGVGDRLLQEDVLARGQRVEGHPLVPVVRGADEHGVHVLVVEDLPVVGHRRRLALGDGRRFLHPRLVHVRDGHQLLPGQILELPHEAPGAPAGADHPDADAVVRAQDGSGGQTRAGQDRGPRAQ